MSKAFIIQGTADAIPLADGSVSMTFCSPPYGPQRTYGINAQRGLLAWVEWMLGVVSELTRVTKGVVLVNCAGWSEDRCYQPGPEMLMAEWWKRGGQCWRPVYWYRVGIPGSGGKQWLRADVEYVLAFKRDAEWLDWSDNTANGHPPKYGPGGEMSNRVTDGHRRNQWGRHESCTTSQRKPDGTWQPAARPSHVFGPFGNQQSSVGRRPNGERKPPYFNGNSLMRVTGGTGPTGEQLPNVAKPFPVLANPGNCIRHIVVGGNKMGHPLAHENEAPFPLKLAEWFIRGWSAPGGTVLDCFGGSGTTADAALRLGRNAVTMDLRWEMCDLTRRRLASPVVLKAKRERKPEPAQPSLFGPA